MGFICKFANLNYSLLFSKEGTRSVLPKDERYAARNPKESKCVAVSFDTINATDSWEEIQEHASGQCRGKEKFGRVTVQIMETGSQAGRWIDYSLPQIGHDITVNLGMNVKKPTIYDGNI